MWAIVESMTTAIEDQGALLREAGLRVTSPRLAVLAVVASRPHVAAEDVASLVRERLGAVSTQTVYDALRVCTDVGLMRRIEDVECAVGHAPCLTADSDRGFEIDEAEVNYWGTCPECRTKRAPSSQTET